MLPTTFPILIYVIIFIRLRCGRAEPWECILGFGMEGRERDIEREREREPQEDEDEERERERVKITVLSFICFVRLVHVLSSNLATYLVCSLRI